MDLCDLTNGLALGQPVEEIADFPCRSEKEARDVELEPANYAVCK